VCEFSSSYKSSPDCHDVSRSSWNGRQCLEMINRLRQKMLIVLRPRFGYFLSVRNLIYPAYSEPPAGTSSCPSADAAVSCDQCTCASGACDPNADCLPSADSSFTCACRSGFFGNGYYCASTAPLLAGVACKHAPLPFCVLKLEVPARSRCVVLSRARSLRISTSLARRRGADLSKRDEKPCSFVGSRLT
jgi:hypothetical protein